ncbi:MAG: CAP domain-containing protein [Beijerinckiaceae bacterium]
MASFLGKAAFIAAALLVAGEAAAQPVRNFRCDDGRRPFFITVTVVNQQTIRVANLDGGTRTLRLTQQIPAGWLFAGGNYNLQIHSSQSQISLNKPNSTTIECLVAQGGGGNPVISQPTPGPRPPPVSTGGGVSASAALQAVNAYRQQSGAQPVSLDPQLNSAARAHSQYMAQRNNLSHDNFQQRMAALGRGASVENVAWGQNSVPEVMNSWRNSSGHAQNMRNPTMRRMGIAKVGAYWTLIMTP